LAYLLLNVARAISVPSALSSLCLILVVYGQSNGAGTNSSADTTIHRRPRRSRIRCLDTDGAISDQGVHAGTTSPRVNGVSQSTISPLREALHLRIRRSSSSTSWAAHILRALEGLGRRNRRPADNHRHQLGCWGQAPARVDARLGRIPQHAGGFAGRDPHRKGLALEPVAPVVSYTGNETDISNSGTSPGQYMAGLQSLQRHFTEDFRKITGQNNEVLLQIARSDHHVAYRSGDFEHRLVTAWQDLYSSDTIRFSGSIYPLPLG
jgi:hypothetical protein